MREKRLKAKANLSSSAEGKCEVRFINTYIGRGVFVKEDIQKDQFLMEYTGQLLQTNGGGDETFKFYFRHNNREWCIDASKTQCTAAMVNDIDKETNANCKMVKRTGSNGQPQLCLFAIKCIKSGSELRYDYGVPRAPWRKQQKNNSRPVLYPEPSVTEVPVNSERPAANASKPSTPTNQQPPAVSHDTKSHSDSEDIAKKLLTIEDTEETPPETEEKPSDNKMEESIPEKEVSPIKPDPVIEPPSVEKQRAIVKPHILTHVIEGFVIQEGPEPFPVQRSSLMTDFMPPKPGQPVEQSSLISMDEYEIDQDDSTSHDDQVASELQPNQDKETLDVSDQCEEVASELQPNQDKETLDVSDQCEEVASEIQPSQDKETLDVSDQCEEVASELQPNQDKETLDVSDQCEEGSELQPSQDKETLDVSDQCEEVASELQPSQDKETLDVSDQCEEVASELQPNQDKETLDVSDQCEEVGSELQPSQDKETLDVSDQCEEVASESQPSQDKETLDVSDQCEEVASELQPNQDKETLHVSDQCEEVASELQPSQDKETDVSDQCEEAERICELIQEEQPQTGLQRIDPHASVLRRWRLDNFLQDVNCSDSSNMDYNSENSEYHFDDDINDPDFEIKHSDENYMSEEDFVSDSDNSNIIANKCSVLKRKNSLGENSENVNKKKRSDKTGSPESYNEASVKLQISKNSKGKRVWDKVHFCVYCQKSFTNLTKHLLRKHKNEPEVSKITNMPLNSKLRKDALLKLRNTGDYKHNLEILKNRNGTLITYSRKEGKKHTVDDYLPCEDCYGFFSKEFLWKHRKNCTLKKTGPVGRKVQSSASFMLPVSGNISEGLKENVLKKMAYDEVSLVIRNDNLILRVGEKLYQKHGHLQHLSTYISQKMRELGRFVINARKHDPDTLYLKDVIIPEKFRKVVLAATRDLCKYNAVTNTFGNPSLAMKLGHLLKKCAKIKKSEALISSNEKDLKDSGDFLSLIENEWTEEVSSRALQVLKEKNINNTELVLPLTEDIITLQNHLKKMTSTLVKSLNTSEKEFNRSYFEELNQVTLARLVLFNRRRGGETQRLTVKAYESKVDKPDIPTEVAESFSPVEKMMCSTFSRMEIRGKKGRTVPVLLTPELENSIELLLKFRVKAGVDANNQYLFARPNFQSMQPIRSTDVLRKYAIEAKVKNPKNITSTKLRKHVATVSQILNLNRHDMETMAEFMGHDIDIHRTYYRLPQETVQVVKMGKLLSAFDNGSIGQYRGMTLDEIPFETEMVPSSENEIDENDDDGDLDVEDDLTENFQDFQGCLKEKSTAAEVTAATTSDVLKHARKEPKSSSKICVKGSQKIQRLSESQTRLLKSLFHTNILLRRELRCEECQKVISKYSELKNLSWMKIKNTVHNWITLEKRREQKRH